MPVIICPSPVTRVVAIAGPVMVVSLGQFAVVGLMVVRRRGLPAPRMRGGI